MKIDTAAGTVTGAWTPPRGASPAIVVGHGAGNDMNAPFLVGFSDGLADAGIGSLRFNFPYKERGRRAPDPQRVLEDAYRAAFERAGEEAGDVPVFAGGKSLGGRIASLLVADGLPAAGIVFLGYPLHAPGRTDRLRDEHLDRIEVPMLFLQGTADPFARFDLLERVVGRLGPRATLRPFEGADHSFRVKGRRIPDEEIGRTLAGAASSFVRAGAGGR